jgi:hypothetical protein
MCSSHLPNGIGKMPKGLQKSRMNFKYAEKRISNIPNGMGKCRNGIQIYQMNEKMPASLGSEFAKLAGKMPKWLRKC